MNLSHFLPFHDQTDRLDAFGRYIYIYMGESSLKPSQMINEKDYFCGLVLEHRDTAHSVRLAEMILHRNVPEIEIRYLAAMRIEGQSVR